MLRYTISHKPHTLASLHKPLLSTQASSLVTPSQRSFSARTSKQSRATKTQKKNVIRAIHLNPLFTNSSDTSTSVKAVVTVVKTVGDAVSQLTSITQGLDNTADLIGRTLQVELVAGEADPKTGAEKATIKAYARLSDISLSDKELSYQADFTVPQGFGEIGAVLIENEHHLEMFVKNIVLSGFSTGSIDVTCNTWVHSKFDNPEKRIFFINTSYLPSQTPNGLKTLREKELKNLRGDGTGQRKDSDRIYDYDVYNDLGDPDSSDDLARPVLGGADHPYPRRCRTGRPKTNKDPLSESRSLLFIYVPRDEKFAEGKLATFATNTVYQGLKSIVPTLETVFLDPDLGFQNFASIEDLYVEGYELPNGAGTGLLGDFVPKLVKGVADTGNQILHFDNPELSERDNFAWLSDTEFARETLAGLNPCCITLVTEWPLKSNLDTDVYGPAESAITKELVEKHIKGVMTFDEALEQKKLFLLDYHDVYLPYVNKVREIKGTTFYGSRTLFFLTPTGMLEPLMVELTRPPVDGKPQWKQVFEKTSHPTDVWLWRLAKAHVLAHDSGYHQLVSHWLRTHCCIEPFIIASNRQLSAMHPIYRLLHPHFRYTMEINALARLALINADGIIEKTFSPRKYAIELSSVAYDKQWQFDLQALPADLINRGMAVEDATAPNGLKLAIEDYPYANDGLLLWDAIKQWVTDYVNYYYPEASLVESDSELQAWWTEIKTVGHGDKKDESWWPELKTPGDLVGILTTIMWVSSGHHAAVNFGQFHYAGYFPNRPTIARRPMPTEDPSEVEEAQFLKKPGDFLLDSFPSKFQAATVTTVLDVLSTHASDEEYIGGNIQPYWAGDEVLKAAFERFSGRLKAIEGIIDARNADSNNINRTGAGIVPYELLKPYSESGLTGKGVPNSISI